MCVCKSVNILIFTSWGRIPHQEFWTSVACWIEKSTSNSSCARDPEAAAVPRSMSGPGWGRRWGCCLECSGPGTRRGSDLAQGTRCPISSSPQTETGYGAHDTCLRMHVSHNQSRVCPPLCWCHCHCPLRTRDSELCCLSASSLTRLPPSWLANEQGAGTWHSIKLICLCKKFKVFCFNLFTGECTFELSIFWGHAFLDNNPWFSRHFYRGQE